MSLDDFRIVFNYLTGDGSYNLETRRNYATTLFIAPPLAQVGLTEQEARDKGLPVAVKELPVAAMPRGHVNADLRGAFKAVVNPETKEILGVTLFGEAAGEIINLITMAMDNKIPYTLHRKTNLYSPNHGRKPKRSLCDLNRIKTLENFSSVF